MPQLTELPLNPIDIAKGSESRGYSGFFARLRARYSLIQLLVLLLMLGWGALFVFLIADREPPSRELLLAGSAAIAALVLWLQGTVIPRDKIAKIERLARQIEERINEQHAPIPDAGMPSEIGPLISAINRLIAQREARYAQERDFTANASHDLRTPLAGIRVQLQIAMRTSDPKQRGHALRRAMEGVDRAARLVEQMLILARLTSDELVLVSTTFDVGDTCERTIGELRQLAEPRNIALDFERSSTPLSIEGSEDSVGILLSNLVMNAIVYSPAGGQVTVRAQEAGEDVLITVADNGPGIPPERRERVLERFNKANIGQPSGTGLGLSIVKRVVELHDGSLELDDVETGTGLLVRVRLPASQRRRVRGNRAPALFTRQPSIPSPSSSDLRH